MNNRLISRLEKAQELLQRVEQRVIQTDITRVVDNLAGLVTAANILHWQDTLQARDNALVLMESIVNDVDREGKVAFGSVRLTFPVARFLAVNGYLTAYWSLADLITSWSGQIFCTKDSCSPGRNAKLTSHFISKKANKTGAALIVGSFSPIFSWPAALLYVLRNQFVHEGGIIEGSPIFLSEQPQDGYLLVEEGWSKLKESAEKKDGVKTDQHRMASPLWMAAEQPDLLEILRDCEKEMDDALGILIGSASNLLAAQVTFLLGEDN